MLRLCSRHALLFVLLAGAVGCATVPPPAPPVVSFETKMSWILRLEDQRSFATRPRRLRRPRSRRGGADVLPATAAATRSGPPADRRRGARPPPRGDCRRTRRAARRRAGSRQAAADRRRSRSPSDGGVRAGPDRRSVGRRAAARRARRSVAAGRRTRGRSARVDGDAASAPIDRQARRRPSQRRRGAGSPTRAGPGSIRRPMRSGSACTRWRA